MMRKAILVAFVGAASLLPVFSHALAANVTAHSALAASMTAHSGDVSATFSFTGKQVPYRNLRLTISRAGQVLYSEPVTSKACSPYCRPAPTGPHRPSLSVLDLESNGQPDVVLDLFSGGAHCCFIDQVFSYDPGTMTYTKTEQDFENSGAALERLGGRYVFVSANNAFYYEFASFAFSGAPIQIFSFSNRHFLDVTRSYPSLIKSDAAVWWKAFTRHYGQGEGFIAPWAADECLLGNVQLVNTRLQTELRENHLHGGLPGVPSAGKFIAALKMFLIKQGYLH